MMRNVNGSRKLGELLSLGCCNVKAPLNKGSSAEGGEGIVFKLNATI